MSLLERIKAAFALPPLSADEVRRIRNLLATLQAAGGFIDDDDDALRMWADEIALAARHGYVSTGGGWSVGVSLEAKGSRLLAA